jgi:hypothetical protein
MWKLKTLNSQKGGMGKGKRRCWSREQSFSYVSEIKSDVLLYSKMKMIPANINLLHNSKSIPEDFKCYRHEFYINIQPG